ncbi:cobalamin biosynthesis protein [Thiocystis violascens]|uniref:Cobalamin biosynthesis protein CbiG n=1 Tax=Thiocystis violascens (strain ATCC 17096 / DSM 198 / 6111) TaxID=765911 RepID=I3Y9K4_THIV6|nr:cobalamin biosynthesis protein [Thiocystis violascens]AFL73672.1 cobalamin biosynthesis protein CbiG [Thiocystis violascens DSM 198]
MADQEIVERLKIAIGLGCRRGVSLTTLESAIAEALRPLGEVEVCCIASHADKADEAALLALASIRGWPLRLFPAEILAAIQVPNPSSRAASAAGTPSVAEAAALLAADGRELLVAKRIHRGADGLGVTVAIARMSPKRGSLLA